MDGRLAAALSHPPILENASNLQQTNPMFPDTSPLATGAACRSRGCNWNLEHHLVDWCEVITGTSPLANPRDNVSLFGLPCSRCVTSGQGRRFDQLCC